MQPKTKEANPNLAGRNNSKELSSNKEVNVGPDELNPEELPPDYMALASVVLGIVGLMLKVCAALVCPVGAGMPWC